MFEAPALSLRSGTVGSTVNRSNHHRYGEVKTRLTIGASGDFASLPLVEGSRGVAMPSKVQKNGRVTVPKRVRYYLGLRPGTKVAFRLAANGAVALERAKPICQARRDCGSRPLYGRTCGAPSRRRLNAPTGRPDGATAPAAARTPACPRARGGTAACRRCRSPFSGRRTGGIVERSDLDDRRPAPPGGRVDQVGAAFGAEFPRNRLFEVAARKLFGRALGIFEAVQRHQHEQVRRAAGHVLAFAAMALRLHHGLALGDIAHLAAIASAFEFHDVLPVCCGYFDGPGPPWQLPIFAIVC